MFLGIDIGTSKSAAVLVDEERRVIASSSRPHGGDLSPAEEGFAEQTPDALIEAAWNAVRDLPEEGRRQTRAIGVCGQMHGVVVLDDANRPLTPLINWQDRRCLKNDFAAELSAQTGYAMRSGYGCATLAWLRRHGRLPAQAASCATIHDWASSLLCGGVRPATDPTDAASWGLFDLQILDWDAQAWEKAGLPLRLAPRVVPCGAKAGNVAASIATALGIPAGIPVAAAIGDNQASLLATLGDPEKEIALTLGTGGQVSVVLPPDARRDWRTPGRTWEYRPFPGRRYAVVAASLCGGAAWAWLADTIQLWLDELGAPPIPRDQIFERMSSLGMAAADEPLVCPNFPGERHDPLLRGAIEGIGANPLGLGSLSRGLARGIITNLRDMLPAEVLAGRARVVASGNALRRSPLVRQMAEEVFGLPLRIVDAAEEAATGAALLASAL